MIGGPDDMGHWLSTLFTSIRESMNFASLTGISTQSQQQGFAGQVQTAMGQDIEFLASVMDLKLQYEDDVSIAQVATANEQFLTAKMNEFGVLESSIQESKISVGRLLATGIFTGLAMLTPSLAGFNLYGVSKLFGGIGSKIDGKIQNMFMAARNSKMLLKSAENSKKQEVDLGKKHVDPQLNDIKQPNTPKVSTIPSVIDPIYDRAPIELELGQAVGATSSGLLYMSPLDPYRNTGQRSLDSYNKEKNIEKSQAIKDGLAKNEEMKNTEENREKNILEQLEEKKAQIFDNIELFDFDPRDPDLQYPLTDNDNIQSIVFKTLLNIIYKNKKSIETVYRKDTRFQFTDDGTINYKKGATHLIHNDNIAVILGINRKYVQAFLDDINNPDFTPLTIRKMRLSLNSLFDHIRLRKAQLIVSGLMENYINLGYSRDEKFIIKFLTLIDDYTDIGVLGETKISENILKCSQNYLRQFKKKTTYKKPGRYFALLVNIYISGESNFGFTDSDKFIAFKKEVTNFVYTFMSKELKVIKETHTSKTRFVTLCETLAALTSFRYRFPKYFSKTTPIKITGENPKGYYTLSELSTAISPKGHSNLLNNHLKTGAPSHQLFSIINLLRLVLKKVLKDALSQNT